MGAPVRYLRMLGGPEGRESLLAALKDGTVLHLILDNSSPVFLLAHTASIRSHTCSTILSEPCMKGPSSSSSVYYKRCWSTGQAFL